MIFLGLPTLLSYVILLSIVFCLHEISLTGEGRVLSNSFQMKHHSTLAVALNDLSQNNFSL